jgi:hypothetical protein
MAPDVFLHNPQGCYPTVPSIFMGLWWHRPITRIDVIRGKGHARPAGDRVAFECLCCSVAVAGGSVFILCLPSTLKDWA